MFKRKTLYFALSAVFCSFSNPTVADNSKELQQMKDEIRQLKDAYEQRIQSLEEKLNQVEKAKHSTVAEKISSSQAVNSEAVFNPAVSVILSGTSMRSQRNSTQNPYQMTGFIPSGAEMPSRGMNLDESEIAISANIDSHFRGNLVFALTPEGEVEVEEAYINTLQLGKGLKLKAGRFFSGVGYLNEQHRHVWDFSDAPLVYQAFLGNQLKDDGVQLKWVAPIDRFLLELGAEIGAGKNFPATPRDKNGSGRGTIFATLGGDVGIEHSWRVGLSHMRTKSQQREFEDNDQFGQTSLNHFSGDSKLTGLNFVWKYSPNGNVKERFLKFQSEYFQRQENGNLIYDIAGLNGNLPQEINSNYSAKQSGYYAQITYQFMPKWRTSFRTEKLNYGSVDLAKSLDYQNLATKYNPSRNSLALEFSPSEFSRIRLQYNQDKSQFGFTDNQLLLQYMMSFGAHGAHRY